MIKIILYLLLAIDCGLWILANFDLFGLLKFISIFQFLCVVVGFTMFIRVMRKKAKEINRDKN